MKKLFLIFVELTNKSLLFWNKNILIAEGAKFIDLYAVRLVINNLIEGKIFACLWGRKLYIKWAIYD